MAGTPRQRAREQTMAEIVRIGRKHLATDGAAALSLRAVARDLGVVSSAVYRYVKSRDDLLTLLLIDGYDELGDAVDAALAQVSEADHRARLVALGHAVRTWALADPSTYALLFGSPVPGYEAPAERTIEPGTRVVRALVELLARAYADGAVAEQPAAVPLGDLTSDFAAIRDEFGVELPDEVLARGVLVWTSLFGAVSFEVFGQYGADTFSARGTLFDHHLAVLAEMVGLRS
ncbi:MAG: TetR/AcrR family transcriptional regulator [Nocardioides sp.]|nr:TetR/AcrR family transcriptional regulator [Nocardioides sp.]